MFYATKGLQLKKSMAYAVFLNYLGIKFLGRWNQYFGYWKIIIPTLTFLLLFALDMKPTRIAQDGNGAMNIEPITTESTRANTGIPLFLLTV